MEAPVWCAEAGAHSGSADVPPWAVSLSPRRLIELHSPDSRNTLVLRCRDTATAHAWFSALHANITALLPQVLAELNATLGSGSPTAGGREVKHIAWLAEQVRTDGMCQGLPGTAVTRGSAKDATGAVDATGEPSPGGCSWLGFPEWQCCGCFPAMRSSWVGVHLTMGSGVGFLGWGGTPGTPHGALVPGRRAWTADGSSGGRCSWQ